MAEELGERSEKPTGKRLDEARSKGQVAKSQDLNASIALISGVVMLVMFGGWLMTGFGDLMARALQGESSADWTSLDAILPFSAKVFVEGAVLCLPMMIGGAMVAYAVNFVQVGWLLTSEPLRPKLSKLSPIAGTKRLFNRKNLMKTVVNTLKLVVVVIVCWLVIAAKFDELAATIRLGPAPAMLLIGRMTLELCLWLSAILLVMAFADLVFQRWQHTQDLKMTKQQVKDERKSLEGDPEMKGRRMRMAREIAGQRIASAVPEADVVITNPTHFSVAVRYDRELSPAPRVVAKGADHLALRIRTIARRADVPVVEKPPLARALYWGVEVGAEIAPEHYQAVAEVLAYVYRLDEGASAAPTPAPTPAPEEVPA